MKLLLNFLFLLSVLTNCTTEGQEIQNTSTKKIVEEVIFIPQDFSDNLSVAADKT
jgi:hypothetical protein